jgi:hypothetical protein
VTSGTYMSRLQRVFPVRLDKNITLFLHAAIYLEVSLFRWTSQNAFSRERAVYKWYCVQCCIAVLHKIYKCILCTLYAQYTQYHLYTAVSRENAFWLVQQNRDISR